MLIITEGLRTPSVVRRTREHKISAQKGKEAMKLAKVKSSGLFKKYKRHNQKRLQLKKLILRKFGPAALQAARQTVQRSR